MARSLDRSYCYPRTIAMGLPSNVAYAPKTTRKRTALRRTLQALLAVACISPLGLNSSAYAQLKTGRDVARDYYPQTSSVQVPRPATNPLRAVNQKEAAKTFSRKPSSLESIAEDPVADDLPKLVRPTQSTSLPQALATSSKNGKAVVTEVAPTRFDSLPKITDSKRLSDPVVGADLPEPAIALAAHQTATKQYPVHSGSVIKRVTPARVVSDVVIPNQSSTSNEQVPSLSGDSGSQSAGLSEFETASGFEGYAVGEPMDDSLGYGNPGHRGTCGDPSCTECGPGYPTLNIRIGFPPLLRCDRITARVEAATFWPSSQNLPSLIRTAEVGVPDSRDLFGGTRNLDQSVQGLRGEFGLRYGSGDCNMLQFRFFDAGAQSLTFDSPRTTESSIVRPYQDGSQTPLVQDSVSIKEPGISNGSALAHAYSDVQGGDILFRHHWMQNCDSTVDWLVGYQNASLTDSIDVHTTTIPTGSTTLLELRDRFRSENRFHGATLGLSRMVYSPRWSLGSMFKLGLGDMQRDVTISGFQKVGDAPASSNGLLARSPANGFYSSNTFVVSPEVNVTLGYRLTQNLEATVGYDYLGLPKVARAGEQIDTVSDLDSANPTRPRFLLQESNFSLHSLNYGLQYRY